MSKLKGKTVIITGGSSGIGRALALKCARSSAKVLIAARSEEKLKKVVKEIEDAGGKGFYHITDVTKPEQVKSLFEYAVDKLGCIDVVFNNAGLGYVKRIYELSDAEIARMINVNVLGMTYVAKYSAQVMKEQEQGHLFNTSSLAGLITVPQWSVYVATKWAVTGLTDSIRQELKPFGVKVTSIHPGAVDTDFFAEEKANINISQLEETIRPEDVADAAFDAIFTDRRKVIVPNMAQNYSLLYKFLPGLTEKMIENMGEDVDYNDEPAESDFAYIKPCPICEE
jgi:short-subunit dehydrogenase